MVRVGSSRCSHGNGKKPPSFKIVGSKTPACWKKHANDGMVSARGRRCARGTCKPQPIFSVNGSKTAAHCKKHAEETMVRYVYTWDLHYDTGVQCRR